MKNIWSVSHQSTFKCVQQCDYIMNASFFFFFPFGDGSEQPRPIGKDLIASELMAV